MSMTYRLNKDQHARHSIFKNEIYSLTLLNGEVIFDDTIVWDSITHSSIRFECLYLSVIGIENWMFLQMLHVTSNVFYYTINTVYKIFNNQMCSSAV